MRSAARGVEASTLFRLGSSVGAVLLAMVLTAAAGPAAAPALGTRQVKVSIEFRETRLEERSTVQGGLVVVERGGVAARGRVGADAGSTNVTRSSGIFTLVQDGGDAMLRVSRRVPVGDVRFFADYARGAGLLPPGIAFQDVGTSLKVHADVLPGDRIRLRLVPSVSYLSARGSGTIDFTEAATELVVENGEPVTIGGGSTRIEEVTRRVLGYGAHRSRGEASIVLLAQIR